MASRAGAGFAERHRLGHEAVAVHRAADQFEQLRHFKRLEQIIVSAEFGRLDGGLRGAEGRDENDGQARLGGVQLAHQVQPVQARHLQIGDDDVERLAGGAGQPVVAASFHDHFATFAGQHPLQGVADAGVVVNQQNFCGGVHSITRGRMIPKVVPRFTCV